MGHAFRGIGIKAIVAACLCLAALWQSSLAEDQQPVRPHVRRLRLRRQLENTIIDKVTFERTPFTKALRALQQKTRALAPNGKGICFVYMQMKPQDKPQTDRHDPLITLSMSGKPLSEVLQALCRSAGKTYSFCAHEFAVRIIDDVSLAPLETRLYSHKGNLDIKDVERVQTSIPTGSHLGQQKESNIKLVKNSSENLDRVEALLKDWEQYGSQKFVEVRVLEVTEEQLTRLSLWKVDNGVKTMDAAKLYRATGVNVLASYSFLEEDSFGTEVEMRTCLYIPEAWDKITYPAKKDHENNKGDADQPLIPNTTMTCFFPSLTEVDSGICFSSTSSTDTDDIEITLSGLHSAKTPLDPDKPLPRINRSELNSSHPLSNHEVITLLSSVCLSGEGKDGPAARRYRVVLYAKRPVKPQQGEPQLPSPEHIDQYQWGRFESNLAPGTAASVLQRLNKPIELDWTRVNLKQTSSYFNSQLGNHSDSPAGVNIEGHSSPSVTIYGTLPIGEALSYTCQSEGLIYSYINGKIAIASSPPLEECIIPIKRELIKPYAYQKELKELPVGQITSVDDLRLRLFFGKLGVSFPKGSELSYDWSKEHLRARNTAQQLRLLQSMVGQLRDIERWRIVSNLKIIRISQKDLDSLLQTNEFSSPHNTAGGRTLPKSVVMKLYNQEAGRVISAMQMSYSEYFEGQISEGTQKFFPTFWEPPYLENKNGAAVFQPPRPSDQDDELEGRALAITGGRQGSSLRCDIGYSFCHFVAEKLYPYRAIIHTNNKRIEKKGQITTTVLQRHDLNIGVNLQPNTPTVVVRIQAIAPPKAAGEYILPVNLLSPEKKVGELTNVIFICRAERELVIGPPDRKPLPETKGKE